jgi:Antitoxin VbhA
VATLVNTAVKTLDRSMAVGSVLASFRMEGLEPDSETAALLAQYAAGSLSLDELGSAIERHVAQMESGEAA